MAKGSRASNLRLLEASLDKRQERARRLLKDELARAEALWKIWQDASQFAPTASRFWPAGRDATLVRLRGGDGDAGRRWLRELLASLQRFELTQQASSCCDSTLPHLVDDDLLALFQQFGPSRQLIAALSPQTRARVTDVTRAAYAREPTAGLTLLLGRLLELSDQGRVLPAADHSHGHERGLEARALRYIRSHGTETAAGVMYEAQYALWRVLTEPDIVEVHMQDLEDLALMHEHPDGRRVPEQVQAKKRDSGWSIANLQGTGTGANKVFDSFAEVLLAEPESLLTFATDSDLEIGAAPDLKRLAEKFHDVSADADTLASINLASVAVTKDQQRALDQLKDHMDGRLVARIDLRRLLARIKFDVGRSRRELRSETIRGISARLHIPDQEAEDAYKAGIGALALEMETRRPLSRDYILGIVDRVAMTTGSLRAMATSGGRVELLDFDGAGRGSASADRYYQGLSTSVGDIVAGFDALRPAMLTEIARVLEDRRCCVTRGASGQGKTTLLFRYAYEVREGMLVVRVHGLDHSTAAEVLHLVNPAVAVPILVLVDDLAGGHREEWAAALRRLLERPAIKVLATSREDAWRASATAALEGLIGFAYPQLDEHTAEVIFAGLSSIEGVRLHAEHWREPLEQAGGLLMEYVHLLTQGRHMRDVITDQLRHLEDSRGVQASIALSVLRYIAAAHSYGGYVSRKTLSALVPSGSAPDIGRVLGLLEAEFLIRGVDHGAYVGLHPVRSRIITAVLHEHDDLNDTLERLLAQADADEVGAMLEELIYRLTDDQSPIVALLAGRVAREGPWFGFHAVAGAYAAEERRYADMIFGLLMPLDGKRIIGLAATIMLQPSSPDISGILSPEMNLLISMLPRRQREERRDYRFLDAIGPARIAAWLIKDLELQDTLELLRLVAVAAPELGTAAVTLVDLDALAARMQEAQAALTGPILTAIRGVDVAAAVGLADRLGTTFLLDKALATIPDCYAVSVDAASGTVRGRFLVNTSDTNSPSPTAARIAAALYDLFPAATESEVIGLLGTAIPHPDAIKRIPRGNAPPPQLHIVLNQYWLSLCSQRLAAKSLAFVLQQHDEVGRMLLAAVEEVRARLGAESVEAIGPALRGWSQAMEGVRDIMYVPYQTAPLHEALAREELQEGWLPGNEPIDRSLNEIQNAALVAHRELLNCASGRVVNCALLNDSLARLQRESGSYGNLRATLNVGDAADIAWAGQISDEARRLRGALEVLILPNVRRQDRSEARRFAERYRDLRAVATDLLKDARRIVSTKTIWVAGVARVAAFRQAAVETLSGLEGYGGYDAAFCAAEALLDLARRLAETPADETTELTPVEVALTSMAQVDEVDVEAWFAGRAWGRQTAESELEAAAALESQGVTATCKVFPASLENPMW